MNSDDTISGIAVIAGLSLVGLILALHIVALRRINSNRRPSYILLLTSLLVVSLFIPILDGGEKTGWIQLWHSYQFLSCFDFYTMNRILVIDALVFGIPFFHHGLCIALAFTITKK